jgi:hypothetical protein
MSPQIKGALRLQSESPEREIPEVPSTNESQTRKQEALENLERFTDQLAVMAHWREQLQGEIDDACVLFNRERFASLTRRIRLFCEVVGSLCDILGGHR